MKRQIWMFVAAAGVTCGLLAGADYPELRLTNGKITAQVSTPDLKKGFYRGTRFDRSGIIYSLEYKGHKYVGQWYHYMMFGQGIMYNPDGSIHKQGLWQWGEYVNNIFEFYR